MNQVIVVGRIVKIESAEKTTVTIAVSRAFKNADGEYETDFIDCVLWTGIAENTSEYCKRGDILGVKGRVQTRVLEMPDEKKRHITEVVAEKVTFLSSNKKES